MNNGSEYVTVKTVSSVRAGFMRGRGSIAWVVVPFNKGKEESKVRRSFEFLSSLLNEILNSSFLFLNNRGALIRWTAKANSMTRQKGPSAIMLAGSNYAKTSLFLTRKIPRTHSMIRQDLDPSTGLGKRSTDQRAESTEPMIHTCDVHRHWGH